MNERDMGQRIRKLRQKSGLTLTAEAKRAELTKGTLSKIETGQISPPIATLMRVAKALNVSITDFFIDADPQPAYVLTRRNQGTPVSHNGSQFGYSYEALALEKRGKAVEPFVLTINPTDPPGEFHHRGISITISKLGCYRDSSLVAHNLEVAGDKNSKFF